MIDPYLLLDDAYEIFMDLYKMVGRENLDSMLTDRIDEWLKTTDDPNNWQLEEAEAEEE